MNVQTIPVIDNDLYDRLADTWWDERGFLNLLRTVINPGRLPYFQRVLSQQRVDPTTSHALDVGCGAAFLPKSLLRWAFLSLASIHPENRYQSRERTRSRMGCTSTIASGTARRFRSKTRASRSFTAATCSSTFATGTQL